MVIKECKVPTDSTHRELTEHGTPDFPVGIYFDDLSTTDVPWHWHEEWEAGIVLEGTGLASVGNQKFVLREGEGFFVNSQILHGFRDLEGSQSKYHSIVFHPRLVGGNLDSVFYRKYIQPLLRNPDLEVLHLKPQVPWQKRILEEIEGVWQSCAEGSRGYEFRVRQLLSDMLLLLLDHAPEVPTQPSAKQQRDAERIKAMLQYIHDHSAEPLNTAGIAGAAAISESECLRCFRSTIGTSPIQYLRQYRIQQAVQLLTTTQLPVSAISEACGFQDVSYFTKTFRETKGCSPTVFRKK